MHLRPALALAVCLLTACKGDKGYEIDDGPLSGVIGGDDWTFSAGETDSFLSDGESFFSSFYGSDVEPCAYAMPEGNSLLASIPTATGEHELGSNRTLTFVVDSEAGPENLVTTDGLIVVDEVTDTSVSGGLYAIFDEDNEVSGQFELTICTE